MQLKCIIIEDEPLAQEKLQGFIGQISTLQLAETFDNAIEAMDYLRENPVDLIFLDIQMQKFNGIQFLECCTSRPDVIIISAYDQYALKGYEFSVTDYLLKPYSFERLMQAVNKVFDKRAKMSAPAIQNQVKVEDEVLFVKSGSKIEKIQLKDILYIQGMNDYQLIVTEQAKIMTLQTLRDIESVLPEPYFVRIHKSYIVALRKIDSIERGRINMGNQKLTITETYKEHFYKVLNNGKNLI